MKLRLFTIPNGITLLNLGCGCCAVVSSFAGDLSQAFWWIVLAAVFDFFDGFAARLLKSYSDIGKQLDSLADDISFGLAPAMVLFALMERITPGSWVNYGAFVVAAFSALRLAKFNVDDRQSLDFIGLPTPASALLIASIGYLASGDPLSLMARFASSQSLLLVLAVVLSVLLVSEIPMFSLKFKTYQLSGNRLKISFIVGSALLLAILGLVAIPFILVLYVVVSILVYLFGSGNTETPVN